MENAMREDSRFKNLLSQDAVTPQQYDKVHTAYLSAKAAYEQAVRSRKMQSAVVTEQGHHLSASEQGIELARRAVDLARPLPSMRHPRRPHKHPESPPLVSLRHRLSSEEKVKKSKL